MSVMKIFKFKRKPNTGKTYNPLVNHASQQNTSNKKVKNGVHNTKEIEDKIRLLYILSGISNKIKFLDTFDCEDRCPWCGKCGSGIENKLWVDENLNIIPNNSVVPITYFKYARSEKTGVILKCIKWVEYV